MPCRSDYMEPNLREKDSHEVAKHIMNLDSKYPNLIRYALNTLGYGENYFDVIKSGTATMYGSIENADDFTRILCYVCSHMTEEQQDQAIYNGREPNARKLADWWDKHKQFDAVREDTTPNGKTIMEKLRNNLTLTEEEKDYLDGVLGVDK